MHTPESARTRANAGTNPARALLRVLAASWAVTLSPAAQAEFEEVRIMRTEPIQVQQACPPTIQPQAVQPQAMQPPPPPPPPQGGIGITGKEALGTAAGAVAGGLLGHRVGSGRGQTAATVAGAAVGGFAGYKLTEEKPKAAPPPPPAQQAQVVCLMTQYRVFYSRPSGLQGDVMMSSMPTSQSLMINFCGDRPCN
jgi:hypothetical protein